MKLQDMLRAVKSLGILKTSTGDYFDKESAGNALININILKAELDAAEKTLKEHFPISELPFEGKNGRIISEVRGEYEQDVTAIFKAISKEDFLKGCKLSKSAYDKKADKEVIDIINLNTKQIGEKQILKVLKNEKIQDLEIAVAGIE
jgi:hypothetical protein